MSLLVATNITKAFGALDVFQGIEARVEAGDRIGLVGPNGDGQDDVSAHPGRRGNANDRRSDAPTRA